MVSAKTVVATIIATTTNVMTTIINITKCYLDWRRTMKKAKALLLMSLVTSAAFAALVPEAAQASIHKVCHWHHLHRICHWAR